jgi:hypothetical protein
MLLAAPTRFAYNRLTLESHTHTHTHTQVMNIIDKIVILETVLPALEHVISEDRSPKMIIAILHCYNTISKKSGPEVVCQRLLPCLLPLCAEMNLSPQEVSTAL